MLDYDTPASISQHFYNGIVIRAHVHSENGTVWLVGAVDCQLGVMATATNNAIQSLQNTVNHITNTVIPISAICPEAMPRYNTWTAPTAEAPNTQPVTVQSRAKA